MWARPSPTRGHGRCAHRTGVDLTWAEPLPALNSREALLPDTRSASTQRGGGLYPEKRCGTLRSESKSLGSTDSPPTFAWMPCVDAGRPEITQTILAPQTSRHPVSPRRRRPSATQASLQIRGVSYQKMLCIPPHLLQKLM